MTPNMGKELVMAHALVCAIAMAGASAAYVVPTAAPPRFRVVAHATIATTLTMNVVDGPSARLRKSTSRQGAGTRADMLRWPSRDPSDPYLRVAPGAWVFPKADPFGPDDYCRDDEGPDEVYYRQNARFDSVVSPEATGALARHYDRHLKPGSAVLDLCAGAFTQLPAEWPLEVTGLGINAEELDANPRLAQCTVCNLNALPPGSSGKDTGCQVESVRLLPFGDSSFDAVIVNGGGVGVLTSPVAVFREVRRVLVPGGMVLVSFGRDEFDSRKQTWRWRDSNAQQRMYLCATWLHFAGGGGAWTDMRGFDVSPAHHPDRNAWKLATHVVQKAMGHEELLFVLQATRRPAGPVEEAVADARKGALRLSTAKYQVGKQLRGFVDDLEAIDRAAVVEELARYVCGAPDEKLSVMQAINPTVLSGLYLDVRRKCPEMSAADTQLLVLDLLLTDYVGDPLDVRKSFLEWMLDDVTPEMLRDFLLERKANREPYVLEPTAS